MFARRTLFTAARSARAVTNVAARKGPDFKVVGATAGAFAAAAFVGYSQQEPTFCGAFDTVGIASSDKVAELEGKLNKLLIQYACKNNMAFVFIKPHAVNGKVTDLVKKTFKDAGIVVTGEGELDAKTIDDNLLIDTHYGAIANRAVKQKPSELIVPDKGKAGFKKMFGLDWDEAVASGQVYNAKDACAKLGVDGIGLEKKWRTLKRGETMIKFGGGFYCGKLDGIYIMNGFYMEMRSAYTTPGAAIHYFTVEWPANALSWEDFRGKVLGATDPSTAAAGSARKLILEQWKSLGLKSQPNTGENGVHASASPYEALAERANWLGQDITTDPYGMGMIAAGVPAEVLTAWSSDPAVNYEGNKGSIFDQLEDKDADDCMLRAVEIAKQN